MASKKSPKKKSKSSWGANTKKKPGDVEVSAKFARMLPVKINPAIVAAKQDRIVVALGERNVAHEKMNADVLAHRKILKGIDAEIEKLRTEVVKGTEDREVQCVEEKNFKTNLLIVRRIDTRAVVEERIMTMEDRQTELGPTSAATPPETKDEKPDEDDDVAATDDDPEPTEDEPPAEH